MLAPPFRYDADVAGCEQQVAIGADVGGADGVLGAAHAPDEGRGPLLGEGLGDLLQLLAGNAGDALDFFRRPLGDFGADLVHAVDALRDELLVFPAIVEDVVQHAPDHGDVGAAAESDIFGGVRGGAGEARVEHEHVGAVDLLAGQDVLQRHRMRFGGIRSHEDDGLRVAACRCRNWSSRRSPRYWRRRRPWWSGRCAPGGRSSWCPRTPRICGTGSRLRWRISRSPSR